MPRTRGRTTDCDAATRASRLRKAQEFLDAAETIGVELPDAYVTLCVLAGIAAADVVCCVRLGVHASTEDHQQAVELLKAAARGQATHLSRLLSMKSKAGYSSRIATPTMCTQAARAASSLLDAATTIS